MELENTETPSDKNTKMTNNMYSGDDHIDTRCKEDDENSNLNNKHSDNHSDNQKKKRGNDKKNHQKHDDNHEVREHGHHRYYHHPHKQTKGKVYPKLKTSFHDSETFIKVIDPLMDRDSISLALEKRQVNSETSRSVDPPTVTVVDVSKLDQDPGVADDANQPPLRSPKPASKIKLKGSQCCALL